MSAITVALVPADSPFEPNKFAKGATPYKSVPMFPSLLVSPPADPAAPAAFPPPSRPFTALPIPPRLPNLLPRPPRTFPIEPKDPTALRAPAPLNINVELKSRVFSYFDLIYNPFIFSFRFVMILQEMF